MNNTLSISVIIPSFHGAHRIKNTLNAVLAQSITPDEIIIVIDGSTDNTRELLLPYENNHEIRVIYQQNKGRASARNKGAFVANSELLVFYDDDTRSELNSLELHKTFHQMNHHAICGGFPLEDERKMVTDFLRYRRGLSLKWTAEYEYGLNRLNKDNLFLTAANLSIRKGDFLTLKGFNPKLTDAEDYELAARALENGFAVYFDKSNIAWHDDLITCRGYIKRQREYANANTKLATYFQRSQPVFQLSFIKRLLYRSVAFPFIVKLIDKGFLRWMPDVLKYMLYDITIHSLSKVYPEIKVE